MIVENELLLSYKYSVVKIIIGLMGIGLQIWVVESERARSMEGLRFISVVIFLISIVVLFGALGELSYTRENRKFRELKNKNINDLKSRSLKYSDFYQRLLENDIKFCIIKNQTTVFRIGSCTVYTHRGMYVDYKYYFIDVVGDKRIERAEYRDFDQFTQMMNRINGNRDEFDIVAADTKMLPE